MYEQRIIPLAIAELLPLIQQCRGQNYRLVQMHATTLADGQVEINYTFVLGGALDNLRLVIPTSELLPSISTYFPAAAFYENEIHDLFGISFSAMTLDYEGNFYRLAKQTPFAPVVVQPAAAMTESAPAAVSETNPGPAGEV